MKLKHIAAAALSVASLVAGSANATETDLGAITTLRSFGGFAAPGVFLDIFKFSLPANGGSDYTVTDFTFLPVQFKTVFSTFALVSSADGVVGSADDTPVAFSSSVGGDSAMSLSFGASAGGNYYLAVSGVTQGEFGGIYNGAISVTAVPEPETYAMMLAGLAAVGFLARRRQMV